MESCCTSLTFTYLLTYLLSLRHREQLLYFLIDHWACEKPQLHIASNNIYTDVVGGWQCDWSLLATA